MITFSKLGSYGHLGNQMFQYAALKAVALKNNYEMCLPLSGHHLFKCFLLDAIAGIVPDASIVQELHFHYWSDLFNCPDNCDLYGYFQSEKYFKAIEDVIRKGLLLDHLS